MLYFIAFFVIVSLLLLLAYKWELGMNMVVPWSVVMGICSALTAALLHSSSFGMHPLPSIAAGTLLALCISAAATLLLFFRDPERIPPDSSNIVVSPADGVIKYVKEIEHGEFPFAIKGNNAIPLLEFTDTEVISGKGVQIGIGLSFLDVHVNRSPIAGRVNFLKKIPGAFKSLKHIRSLLENERAVAVIEGRHLKIGIVLIASRLVRRISMYVHEGDDTVIGQRIGMIRFGSQADVLIPLSKTLTIPVKPGDKVKAGVSVIARYE